MIPISHLRLSDVMDRHVFSVTPECSLGAMVERMKLEHISHVVVLDGRKAVGMLTERDLVRLLHQRVDRSRLVRDFMSAPVLIVPGDLGFRSAYVQLCLSRLRHIVVVDSDGAVVGVAAERDFLGQLGRELFQSVRGLRDVIDRSVPRLSPALPVAEVVELMIREKRGCVVVTEDERYLGLFTEQQIPTILARHDDGSPVALGEVVLTTVAPLVEIASIAEVMEQMVTERLGHVAVVDTDQRVIGTVAQTRLLENVRTAVYVEMATRHLVEDQLLQVEAQLEATLEHTPNVAVQWYDRDGCVHYWNHASETIYGWTAAEAVGKTLDQLMLPVEEFDKFKGMLADIESTGRTLGPIEHAMRHRDGSQRWIESTLFPIPGDDPEESFFVSMDVDISVRKQVERTLRESEARSRAMLDAIPDMVFRLNRQGVFLDYKADIQGLHYQSGPIVGKLHREVLPPEFVELLDSEIQTTLDSGTLRTFEYRLMVPGRGPCDFEARMAPSGADEVTALVRDITERKHAESSLITIADFVSQDHGERGLDAIAEFAAGLFGVDYAHIALVEPDQVSVRVVAAFLDGKSLPSGYVYALAGTPCENVMQGVHRGYLKEVQALFPADHDLVELRAMGYVGEPIVDAQGHPIGLIVLVSRQPLTHFQETAAGLRILAARAGTEIVRKESEAKLRDSEAQLQSILDNSGTVVFFKDLEGRYLVINRRYEEIFRVTRQFMIGKSDYDLFPKTIADGFRQNDLCALIRDSSIEEEELVPHADGSQHIYLSVKFPLKDANGQSYAVCGISTDITERKRVEEKIHQLLSEQEAMLESELVGIAKAKNRVITWCNATFEKLMGYNTGELLGVATSTLYPSREAYEALGVAAYPIMQTGGVYRSETEFVRKDGHHVWVDTRGALLDKVTGESLWAFADITERKRAEQELEAHRHHLEQLVDERTLALREREQRLAETQRIAHLGSWEFDLVSQRLSWSDETFRIAGLVVGDAAPSIEEYRASVHPDDLQALDACIKRALREYLPYELELRHRRPDGSFNITHTRGQPVIENGQVVRLVGSVLDIAERKQAEQALIKAKAAAESANIAKSAFLANMSHEIRTPLNAITGMAHLIRRSGLLPKQAEQMGKLEAAGQHLLGIINAILELSKIEAGKFVLEETDVSVSNLLGNIVSMLQDRAYAKQLQLTTLIASLPPHLLAILTI